jgi:putative NIF3 family GTP cyclohydrolase 1 type 2
VRAIAAQRQPAQAAPEADLATSIKHHLLLAPGRTVSESHPLGRPAACRTVMQPNAQTAATPAAAAGETVAVLSA